MRADSWSAAELGSAETLPTTDPPDPWIGREIGRFKLLERIGSGGMAVVYRAQEQGLIHRDVAIKLLTPESALSQATLARFLKEAQLIADIRHPNVVHVIDVGRTEDGQLYLVMELLVGHTLQQEMREMAERGEAFTWERAASITLQICSALKAAHKHKVVHRDIKPSNCFCIEFDGHQDFIKLLDFGIAKAQAGGASEESLETPLTQEGMFVGTPHYAAPEVIAGRPDWPIDGRVDVFAVGVILYQMLTGSLPFQGGSKLDVLYRTVHVAPPSPRERAPDRDISPEVDRLVMAAIAIDPNVRFASVGALSAAIRAQIDAPRPSTVAPPAGSDRGGVLRNSGIVEPARGAPPIGRSAVIVPRDGQETPPSPGEARLSMSTARPAEREPTASSPAVEPPTSGSRGLFGVVVVMLVGLVALLGLLLHELGSGPEPPPKSPTMPRHQVTRPAARQTTPEHPKAGPPAPVRAPAEPAVAPADVVELSPVVTLPKSDPEVPTHRSRARSR